jgi:hypothetical protein
VGEQEEVGEVGEVGEMGEMEEGKEGKEGRGKARIGRRCTWRTPVGTCATVGGSGKRDGFN